MPNFKMMAFFGANYMNCSADSVISMSGTGRMTLRDLLRSSATYIPTGRQYITYEDEIVFGYCEAPVYNQMQAINVNKVGAGDETLTLADNRDRKWNCGRAVNPNMLFFMS